MPRTRPPLERRVFREEIREKLIEDILYGRLAPGARIVETRIAQQLGVSQGPVREALRDLELLGFVVSSPFRGTQVRQISTDDLLEIYPIRAALEGVAARGAALKLDAGMFEQLEEMLINMRSAAARTMHTRRRAPMRASITSSSRLPATGCSSTSGSPCASRLPPASPTP